MSYYYNYYIGYKYEGKFYPLGPYNCFGELVEVICRSRNWASDLHNNFYYVPEDAISDELREEFQEEDWNGNLTVPVKYLELDKLPKSNFIRRGYFLIEDVRKYEKSLEEGREEFDFDGFYDCITPTVYASMLEHEIKFGKPEPKYDDCGDLYYPKSASDYMYYAYPDYSSEEYEVFIIREMAEKLNSWSKLPNGAVLVALETEG